MPPQGRRLMRDDLRPSHIVERKRKKAKRIFLVFVAVFFLVVGAVVYIFRLPTFQISSVEITGNKVIDTKDIQAVVDPILSQKYLFVFPKNNFLIYPQAEIFDALEKKFPRAEYINLSLQGQKLVIEMKERGGRFLWCGDAPTLLVNDEECYFTDGRGYIFDNAPYFSDNVYLKIYGIRSSGEETIIGSKVLSEDLFLKAVNLRTVLYEKGVHSVALFLKPDGDYEFLLTHPSSDRTNRPRVIFSKNGDYATIANNLISALENEPLKTDFKEKYSQLEYLDVRFDKKVLFKFKEVDNAD